MEKQIRQSITLIICTILLLNSVNQRVWPLAPIGAQETLFSEKIQHDFTDNLRNANSRFDSADAIFDFLVECENAFESKDANALKSLIDKDAFGLFEMLIHKKTFFAYTAFDALANIYASALIPKNSKQKAFSIILQEAPFLEERLGEGDPSAIILLRKFEKLGIPDIFDKVMAIAGGNYRGTYAACNLLAELAYQGFKKNSELKMRQMEALLPRLTVKCGKHFIETGDQDSSLFLERLVLYGKLDAFKYICRAAGENGDLNFRALFTLADITMDISGNALRSADLIRYRASRILDKHLVEIFSKYSVTDKESLFQRDYARQIVYMLAMNGNERALKFLEDKSKEVSFAGYVALGMILNIAFEDSEIVSAETKERMRGFILRFSKKNKIYFAQGNYLLSKLYFTLAIDEIKNPRPQEKEKTLDFLINTLNSGNTGMVPVLYSMMNLIEDPVFQSSEKDYIKLRNILQIKMPFILRRIITELPSEITNTIERLDQLKKPDFENVLVSYLKQIIEGCYTTMNVTHKIKAFSTLANICREKEKPDVLIYLLNIMCKYYGEREIVSTKSDWKGIIEDILERDDIPDMIWLFIYGFSLEKKYRGKAELVSRRILKAIRDVDFKQFSKPNSSDDIGVILHAEKMKTIHIAVWTVVFNTFARTNNSYFYSQKMYFQIISEALTNFGESKENYAGNDYKYNMEKLAEICPTAGIFCGVIAHEIGHNIQFFDPRFSNFEQVNVIYEAIAEFVLEAFFDIMNWPEESLLWQLTMQDYQHKAVFGNSTDKNIGISEYMHEVSRAQVVEIKESLGIGRANFVKMTQSAFNFLTKNSFPLGKEFDLLSDYLKRRYSPRRDGNVFMLSSDDHKEAIPARVYAWPRQNTADVLNKAL